ncbi:MAG: hypothetical protein ABIG30_01165 [Candidatus Aenigmatarchaeota archaeon]
MKIRKFFGVRTDASLFVSKVIDKTVPKMLSSWPWDEMAFSIGRETADRIYIPLDDFSIASRDGKATAAFVMQRMYLYYLKRNGVDIKGKISGLLEQLIANRLMVKNGFSDELSYYFYHLLAKKKKYVRTPKEFIELSNAWLSFYGTDEFNMLLFRDMIRNQFKIETNAGKKGSEFITFLKGDLKDNIYNHMDDMVKKYYEVTRA